MQAERDTMSLPTFVLPQAAYVYSSLARLACLSIIAVPSNSLWDDGVSTNALGLNRESEHSFSRLLDFTSSNTKGASLILVLPLIGTVHCKLLLSSSNLNRGI
jgi:hypothetical protein